VCLNKRTHATVHDERPGVKESHAKWYEKHYQPLWDHLDANLPKVRKIQNPNLVVWPTGSSANSSTSLWAGADVATGFGWYAPPDPKVLPTRTLVGKYGFFTAWILGNYGHYLHDHLPSLAYLRKATVNEYDEDARFILPDFGRYKEMVNFTDPEFYKRIDWVAFGEVVKIEGEVIYLEPTGFPEFGGHALMKYVREWLVEAHPFDQADFDTNKHVVFYNRTGTARTRILDSEQEKKVVATIRAAMDRHGLGDQEIVIFSGKDKNGETVTMDEQFQIFRRASTIIGPHGSGMSNMIWTNPNPKGCEARPKILEFVPGEDVAHVQTLYGGYYRSFRALPLDYHEIFYQVPSINTHTFISLTELENGLNAIWGDKQFVKVEAAIGR
jgi:Glycosyltransferase 61